MAARLKAQAAQVWAKLKQAEGTERWQPLFQDWGRLYGEYMRHALART